MISNEERQSILTRAVHIAAARGFDTSSLQAFFNKSDSEQGQDFMLLALSHSPHSLIFRHDFARAFFGDEKIKEEYPVSGENSDEFAIIFMPAWQAHLRKMVLEDDPLLYLKPFV